MVDPRRRISWLLAGAAVVVAMAAIWFLSLGGAGSGQRDAGRAGTGGPGGEAPVISWTPAVTVDSGPGRVGPWRMNRSDWRYVDDPTVALDGRGRAVVAWVDQERKSVLLQRYGPDGTPLLDEPVDVSRSPGTFSWLPRAAVAPEDPDRIYVLWQEIVFSGGTHGGEAFFARSADGGRTFGEPVNLSRTPAGAGKGRLTERLWHNGSLDLAVGPDGTVHAAWTVYEGGLFVARSSDGGESFSEPLRVTSGSEGGAEPARGPSLAAGPDGAVHLAWAVGGDPSADLRHAASRDGGRTFGEPRALFPGPGHADAPKLAAAGDGTLHLAWAEGPDGPGGGYRVRYARSPAGETPPRAVDTSSPGTASAGSTSAGSAAADSSRRAPGFSGPRTVSGRPDEAGAGARFPHLALDGSGNPRLLWERHPDGQRRSRGLVLAVSADGGDSFSAPALVPGTDDPRFQVNGSLQGLLMRKLAAGPDGILAVVNSGFEPGEASRVLLVRGVVGRP